MKNISQTLANFENLRMAVIGDLMLDRTSWGITSDRKNPESKEGEEIPIIQIQKEKFFLGGAGNVARNIVSLGANCDFYGIVGNDLYGRELIRMCEKEEIGIKHLYPTQQYPTTVKARHFVDGKYKERDDIEVLGKINEDLAESLWISFKDVCIEENYDGVILSDYNKHIFSKYFAQRIIDIASEREIPIFADIKPSNLDFFKGCTLICPNAKEASEMTEIKYSRNNLDSMGKMLQDKLKSKYIVITCSEDGAYVYNNGNTGLIETQAKKVGEVTGAGDTFISTLSLGMASGRGIYDSVALANYAAGIAVEKIGTSAITQQELLKRIEKDKL